MMALIEAGEARYSAQYRWWERSKEKRKILNEKEKREGEARRER